MVLHAVALGVLLQSPAVTQVLRDQACQGCRIELTRLARIGDIDGDGMLEAQPTMVQLDSRGRVFIAVAPPSPPPYVFDPHGRFVTRIGRRGKGPNEYSLPNAILVGPGDSVHVLDSQNGRRTVLDPSLRVARSAAHLSPSLHVAVTRSNMLLLSTVLFAKGVPHKIHILDADGAVSRSFGSVTSTYRAYGPSQHEILADGVGPYIWSVKPYEYVISKWSLDGELLKTLNREALWFEASPVPSSGALGKKPTARVSAIRQDAVGRIWALSQVASPGWRNALGRPVQRTRVGITYPKRQIGRLFDTVVEVIDPDRSTVIASTRIPGYLQFLAADTVAAQIEQDEQGVFRVQLWRLRLIHPHSDRR